MATARSGLGTVVGPVVAVAVLCAGVAGIRWIWLHQGSIWSALGESIDSAVTSSRSGSGTNGLDSGSSAGQPPFPPPSHADLAVQSAPGKSLEPKSASETGFVRFDTSELRQLEIPENASLRAFLESSPAWPQPSTAPVARRWTWSDDRNALLYNGACEAEYIDPDITPMSQSVTAPIDIDLIQRMEQHFGYRGSWLSRSWFTHDPSLVKAQRSLEARLRGALQQHGIELKDGMIGADHEEILRRSLPPLKPLAERIVREWKPFSNGPMHDQRIEAITSFVQRAIPYVAVGPLPDGKERGGLRLPGTTLLEGGDCDCKSLLLATLLRATHPRLPIILVSTFEASGEPHMLIGVGVPATGCAKTVSWQGVTYTYIESTDGFGVGNLTYTIERSRIYKVEEIPFIE
jgi:hypothetical protein